MRREVHGGVTKCTYARCELVAGTVNAERRTQNWEWRREAENRGIAGVSARAGRRRAGQCPVASRDCRDAMRAVRCGARRAKTPAIHYAAASGEPQHNGRVPCGSAAVAIHQKSSLAAVVVCVTRKGALDSVPRVLGRILRLFPRQARGAFRAFPVTREVVLEVRVPRAVRVAMA